MKQRFHPSMWVGIGLWVALAFFGKPEPDFVAGLAAGTVLTAMIVVGYKLK